MRAIIVLIALIVVATAQYGTPAEVKVDPIPHQAECAVNKNDCEARSYRACGPKVTSSGKTCRSVFTTLCQSDETFSDAAACITRCDVAGDKYHSETEKRNHCRNGDAGGTGVGGLCAERVCKKAQPVVDERPAPQPECAVNKDDCEARSFRACGPKITSSGHTCRNVFKALCQSDETFADAASCITRCNVEGDQWHSKYEKQTHCRNGDAGGTGVGGLCAERVCKKADPQPPRDEPAPKAKSASKPKPAPKAKSASKPKPAPKAKSVSKPKPVPQPQPPAPQPQAPPAPKAVPVPCQEDRVIYVATDDDCVDRLQDEVDKLSLVVQKLKVLLLIKGVPVPEKCDSPPIFPPRNDNPPNSPPNNPPNNGGSTTTPGGNNNNGGTTTPGGNNNGGTTTPGGNNRDGTTTPGGNNRDGTTTPGGNNNGGTTTPGGNNNGGTTTPGGNNNGGTTTPGGNNRDGTTTPGGNNRDGTTTPGGNNNNGGTTTPGGNNNNGGTTTPGGNNNGETTPPTGTSSKRVATTSSGGGVSSGAVVGATIGAAACAGIAAVAIGFFASGAGASAAAPASAAGMPCASVNPLYQAQTSGAENSLYGQ